MNTIFPIFKPISDAWDYYTNDPYRSDLEEFKGAQGFEWIGKQAQVHQHRVQGQHTKLQKRFNEDPQVADVVEDNLLRLTLLYGVERHITFRQAYGVLKNRFMFGDSSTAAYGKQFTNGGFFTGTFRGIFLNAFHFVGSTVHPLFYSRGTDYLTHYLVTSAFEILTFPLDTIKTVLQADVAHQYRSSFDVVSKYYESGGLRQFYRGILSKLGFNAFFIFHLRNIYENDSLQYLSFPLLGLSYAFLTLKTRQQLNDSLLTHQTAKKPAKFLSNFLFQNGVSGIYRGVVPFLVLNHFFHYNLYALYSKSTQEHTLEEIRRRAQEVITSPKHITFWA